MSTHGCTLQHCTVFSLSHSAHARAGELVPQALDDGLGHVGLGIRRGQPCCEKQGAHDSQHGINNRLQHGDLLFNKSLQLSKLNASRGQASGVSAVATVAPTRQKRPKPVSVHWAEIISIVAEGLGDECMESPAVLQRKSPRAIAAGFE